MPPMQSDRRAAWTILYSKRLPAMARAKHPAQQKWPVTLDHCFGRIILDQVVGKGQTAWNQRLRGPAVRNMTDEQVDACIELGEKIASGDADLVELDEQSLAARGKRSKYFGSEKCHGRAKRKREQDMDPDNATATKQIKGSEDDAPKSSPESHEGEYDEDSYGDAESSLYLPHQNEGVVEEDRAKAKQLGKKRREEASLEELQDLVRSSSLVDSRKQILLALLQVPKGSYTTYGAISDHLKSSPRAIGNGMRNNPFAPEVPCHRVLAADGKIGGYCGQWGEGDLIDKKRKILRNEGVKFDGRGKVVGSPWRGFT